MNNKRIVKLYEVDKWTLRMIADKFKTNHHKIKKILISIGVEITQKGRKRKPFTDAHRQKIRESSKGRSSYWLGKKMNRELLLKNMKAHLKYDVSLEWLDGFDDIEKLKYLNRSISRKRDYEGFNTEIYTSFIETFYKDEKFNRLYEEWVKTNNKWIKPSLDHIESKSTGGSLSLNNVQFVSWLENRAKVNIPQTEWNEVKKNIEYYL
jgi:hypothetical protein